VGVPRPLRWSTLTNPVVVVGQIARDIALRIDEVPPAGHGVDVAERRELLGGKGANIAVGLVQLGVPVTLIGVLGDDLAGDCLSGQCVRDGVPTEAIIHRAETASALMLDVVTADGRWRYLESVPNGALLTADDIRAQAAMIVQASTVVVQLQQPADALSAVVGLTGPGCRIILDGATPSDETVRHELLRSATVLRCDAREAELIAGRPVPDVETARDVAHQLMEAGPELVVLAVGEEGDLAVWPGGEMLVPLIDAPVVDTTGGGDAFVAALTWALTQGCGPAQAVQLATAAAGLTVRHLAGRPALTPERVRAEADRVGSLPGRGR
jgi:ribokinase